MTIMDPLADMYTRIRNAVRSKKDTVDIPSSKIKLRIAEILKREGYIENYKYLEDNKQGVIRIKLRYIGRKKQPAITQIKSVSRPGLRQYVGKESIPKVLNGYGIAIITTSKGVLTDRECRKEKVGGEVLCYVW